MLPASATPGAGITNLVIRVKSRNICETLNTTKLDEVPMSLTTTTAPSQMLVGGDWINACNGGQIAVENPATKQPIQEVPRAEGEDVDNAVRAAAQAFISWSKTVPRDRGRMLLDIADSIESRVDELARIIATETGNAWTRR